MRFIVLVMSLIIISVFIIEEIRMNELQKSYDELSLDYSYSMEMLGGFLNNRDGMDNALKGIKNNINPSV